MKLDDRLAATARQISEEPIEVDAEAALAATHARHVTDHRRGRRRVLAVGVAAALLLVVGTVAVLASGNDPDPSGEKVIAGPSEEPAPAPPPVDESEIHLWLSADEVPPSGADLSVFLIDPDPNAGYDTFGVGVDLERWDGDSWGKVSDGSVCMGFWDCPGGVFDPDVPTAIPDIGLSPSNGMGPLTWFRVGELDEGWYRLTSESNEGTVAAGQFEVRADAPVQPPVEQDPPGRMALQPPLRLPTMSSTSAQATFNPKEGQPPLYWWQHPARFERWDGTEWVPDGDTPPKFEAGIDPYFSPEFDGPSIDLGNRPPGAYRIVIDVPEGAEGYPTTPEGTEPIIGRFWVADA